MSDTPQPPRSSDPAIPTRNSSRLIDLIAFLAVLALGGVLMALGHITAGSLATVCAALGGLYGVWKRLRSNQG
jgi:4-hydroxybenzoate polyprenyltransferase